MLQSVDECYKFKTPLCRAHIHVLCGDAPCDCGGCKSCGAWQVTVKKATSDEKMPPCLRENGGAQPIRVNGMATVNMIMLSSAYEGTNGERAYPRVPTCHARQEMSACRQGAESARVQKTVAARPTGQEGHARRRRAHAHASRAHQARRKRRSEVDDASEARSDGQR